MISQKEIILPSFKWGCHLITSLIERELDSMPQIGMVNLFICHTSAALSINENANPSVRRDFEHSLNHLIPENASYYTHTLEGSDDMPAHMKYSPKSKYKKDDGQRT